MEKPAKAVQQVTGRSPEVRLRPMRLIQLWETCVCVCPREEEDRATYASKPALRISAWTAAHTIDGVQPLIIEVLCPKTNEFGTEGRR